jgi:hypothetical protein
MARARRREDADGRMTLTGPPAESLRSPRRETLPAGYLLRRIYWPEPWGTTATSLRHNGPRARFDHHRRPAPFPATADDPERGILYAAPSFACCVLECFGDDYVVDPSGARLAVLETTVEIRLLDLRGGGALSAGTVAAINQDGDREVTQDWARWWYEYGGLADIHGLLFFEPVFDEPLVAPEVYAELLVVADELDLFLSAPTA